MSLDPHSDWWRTTGKYTDGFWEALEQLSSTAPAGDYILVPRGFPDGYNNLMRPVDLLERPPVVPLAEMLSPGPRSQEYERSRDQLAESLDILYSQLETKIVTSGLNPENLAIETWTECDETSFRVCARFVPRADP